MGDVIHFPFRPRNVQPLGAQELEIHNTLIGIMGEQPARVVSIDIKIPKYAMSRLCPDCQGRDWIFWSDGVDHYREPCPCGGDDENRIYPDGPDYPGAA